VKAKQEATRRWGTQSKALLHAGFLLDLLFKLEDAGDMFLVNVG
jgi:hypothetical protein